MMNLNFKRLMSVICSGTIVALSPGVGVYEALANAGIRVAPSAGMQAPGAAAGAGVLPLRLDNIGSSVKLNLDSLTLPSAAGIEGVSAKQISGASAQSVSAQASQAAQASVLPSVSAITDKTAALAVSVNGAKPGDTAFDGLKKFAATGLSSKRGSGTVGSSLKSVFDGGRLNAAGALGDGADYTPGATNEDWESALVQMRPSKEVMEELDADQKHDATEVSSLMKGRLFKWTKVRYAPPKSVFSDEDGQLISVGNLFRRPTGDAEVERIGSERRRFSAQQMAQVKEDAFFKVASEEFPGQEHEWKLGGLVQRGRRFIREAREKTLAAAYDNAAIQTPERITGGGMLSLNKTVPDFFGGLWDTIGLFYGRIRTRGLSDYEISDRIAQKRSALVREAAEKNGVDTTLFDAELMSKAKEILYEFDSKAAEAWEKNGASAERRISAELAQEGLTGDAYKQALADRMAMARNDELFSLVKNSAELEVLRPGLGEKLIAHGKALQLIRSAEAKLQRKMQADWAQRASELRAAHPIKSRVYSWMDKRQAVFEKEFLRKNLEASYIDVDAALNAQGLSDEAFLLRAERSVERELQGSFRKSLLKERRPLHRFSFEGIIWLKKNWKITQDPETGKYSVEFMETLSGTSAHPAWRFEKALMRYMSLLNNGAYYLLVENVWNGNLGLRSLFSAKPFQYDWDVNSDTGKLEAYGKVRQTMVSRIRSLWASRREILKDHENKNNYGHFGKAFERFLLFFTADLGRGVIAPLAVLIGQPILTAANAAFSLGATVASIAGVIDAGLILAGQLPLFTPWVGAGLIWTAGLVGLSLPALAMIGAPAFTLLNIAVMAVIAWAPAISVGALLFDALIYDTTGTMGGRKWYGRLFPWLRTLGVRAFWSGVVLSAVSAAGVIYHPIAAFVLSVFALVRSALRGVYDAVMRGAVSTLGRIPGRNARFLVRRVKGPGLSSEFYFQVAPELALVAFWAGMERGEHNAYKSGTQAKIAEPKKAYDAFIQALSAVTGRGSVRPEKDAPGLAEILAVEAKLKEGLKEAVKPNDELYGKLLDIENRGQIKMTLENYKQTLAKGSLLAERFYSAIFKARGYGESDIAAFWSARSLSKNDWVSLAKIQFSEIFGEGFLTPLEESDTTLKVGVKAPSLGDYATGLEEGILPEDLDKVRLGRIGTEKPAQEGVDAAVPVLRYSDLSNPVSSAASDF
jgi:hypothetical protein